MTDSALLVALASAGTAAIAIAAAMTLKGWQEWLEVRRLEIGGGRRRGGSPGTGRPELANLKERVRRLEAIANGGDG